MTRGLLDEPNNQSVNQLIHLMNQLTFSESCIV